MTRHMFKKILALVACGFVAANCLQSDANAAKPPACRGGAVVEMVAIEPGVLRQCGTSLVWRQQDNGVDIDWASAQRYCSDLGSGWRQPTLAELHRLNTGKNAEPVKCGSHFCRVPKELQLSSYAVWASDMHPYDSARTMQDRRSGAMLNTLMIFSEHGSVSKNNRSLCVRTAGAKGG